MAFLTTDSEISKHLFAMVTTTGSARYTPPALESFFANTAINGGDRFILIDNNGTFDRKMLDKYSALELHTNTTPKSFAANANWARSVALRSQSHLVFLNNDIIFPARWFEEQSSQNTAITTPLSNREIQYKTNLFNTTVVMELDQYLANPKGFEFVANLHRQQTSGELPVLTLPFFCVKIPQQILASVGEFDELFGVGGGEDYDYCLRAHLAGFPVAYIRPSYLLHFGGKSTYSGIENSSQQLERERVFKQHFHKKWGADLTNIALLNDFELFESRPDLQAAAYQGRYKELILSLQGTLSHKKGAGEG